MIDIHLQTPVGELPWTCRNQERPSRYTGRQSNPQKWLASQRIWSVVKLETTRGYKAKDITPSITWRREAWKEEALDDLPWKNKRGPSSIRWTLEPFQRHCWGNWDRVVYIWAFLSAWTPSWTEQIMFPCRQQKHSNPPCVSNKACTVPHGDG